MCGLVGLVGKIDTVGKSVFRCLLELDTMRGPHSTGVLFVDDRGRTDLLKKVGTPWDLYSHKATEEAFKSPANLLMGHNRWATQGKINNANAHPFDMGNIIGAHNGTLTSRYNLQDHLKFDVDSENLYHHMEENGVADTIPKLNGAFALTWWDKTDETLNIIRNDKRPLHYALTTDKKTLLWASEPWMLIVATSKHKMEIGEVEEFEQEVLHTFSIELGFAHSAKELNKPHLRKMQMYVPPAYPVHSRQTVFPKPALVAGKGQVVIDKGVTKTAENTEVKKTGGAASFMEYQKCVGKDIDFYVWGGSTNTLGQRYIQCYGVDDERLDVRCYAEVNTYLWKKLLSSSKHFKGSCKAFSSSSGNHLTIDLRSVVEIDVVDAVDDTPLDLFLGYGGELLTLTEYEKATENGCAWCSGHVDEEDAPKLTFISGKEFVCGDCAELSDVKEFINQAN